MNKTALSVLTIGLVVVIGIIFSSGSKINNGNDSANSLQNVEMRNGVQYITVSARGGYSPRVSTAKAGIPTKLIMKTNGTFDCSSSLVINSLDYRKILPQSGETEIDLGLPKAGEPLQGVCGMGMYSFEINFI